MWTKFITGLRQTADYFSDELRIIRHDGGALLIFIIAMIVYPVIYSVAYQNEIIRDNHVGIVDLDHTALSRQYSQMLDATEQLQVTHKPASLKEAEQLFYDGDIQGIVLVPEGFEKAILRGEQAHAQVYCDASYLLIYKQVYAGATYATGTLGAGIEIKKLLASGVPIEQALKKRDPLTVQTNNLYNPGGGYGTFVMPGIILVIMQQTLLIGIGLLGGTFRERKKYHHIIRHTEKKGASIPAVLGKSFAYLSIYLLNSLFTMVLVHKGFNFPDKSGFLMTLLLLIPFFLSISFLGIAISVLFKRREHSMLFMVFLSPAVLFLSGLSWPASSIPPLLYQIAHLFPSTVMVPAYLRMRLFGAGIESVHYEWSYLMVQMGIYFILACISYRVATKRFSQKEAASGKEPIPESV